MSRTFDGITMLKKISLVLAFLMVIMIFTACAECIDTKRETVEVVITDAYYEDEWTQFIPSGKALIPIVHSARYIITVKHNGVEYDIDDSDVYEGYKYRIGDTVEAVLETRTYDDGRVTYDILELRG